MHTLLLRKTHNLFRFFQFSSVFWGGRRIGEVHPGHCITFSFHISLGFIGYGSFSDFFLFLMTLKVLQYTSHMFCRLSFNWDLSDGFPRLAVVRCFGEEDHKHKVPFFSHHSKGIVYQHDL